MTQKPIKATLDNSDDSIKTQKPILIQLDDIPTPTSDDAGKILGVDNEGKYALTEGGGGEKYYEHIITGTDTQGGSVNALVNVVTKSPTPWTLNDLKAFLINYGFNDYSHNLLVPNTIEVKAAENKLSVYKRLFTYTDKIYLRHLDYTLSIVDNNIKISSTGIYNNLELTAIVDTVVEI